MTVNDLDAVTVVIARSADSDQRREKLQSRLADELAGRDVDVLLVGDLYDLSPDGPGIRRLRSLAGDLIVAAWQFPRNAHWILNAHGIFGRMEPTSSVSGEEIEETPQQGGEASREFTRRLWYFDLRAHDRAEDCVAEIDRILASRDTSTPSPVPKSREDRPDGPVRIEETTTDRWYPVIDYDRCTDCLECLNFCLFGVFGFDEEESILVEQPDACRAGCPACSRICPAAAIMFPRHDDPAIAGDPSADGAAVKVDLSILFGASGAEQLAAAERDRALAEEADGPDDLDRLVDEVDEMEI